jgi:hypothetical protein
MPIHFKTIWPRHLAFLPIVSISSMLKVTFDLVCSFFVNVDDMFFKIVIQTIIWKWLIFSIDALDISPPICPECLQVVCIFFELTIQNLNRKLSSPLYNRLILLFYCFFVIVGIDSGKLYCSLSSDHLRVSRISASHWQTKTNHSPCMWIIQPYSHPFLLSKYESFDFNHLLIV